MKTTMNNKDESKAEESTIKCYQCKNELCEYPIKFNCNHYMCSSCLIHELLLSQFKTIENKHDILFSCKCHIGTHQMSFENFIQIQKEITKPRTSGTCLKHSNKGIKYCTECELWLCGQCISIHEIFNSHHKIIEEELSTKKLCPTHLELTRFFCTMCGLEICPLCIARGAQHHGHNYFDLDNFSLLTSEIGMKFRRRTSEEFAKYIEILSNDIMLSIDNKYNETIKLFDEIYAQFEIVKNDYKNRMESSKQRAKEIIDIVTYSFFHFYQDLNKRNKNSNLLYYLNQVIEISSIIPFFTDNSELNKVQKHLSAFGNLDYLSIRINSNKSSFQYDQSITTDLKRSLAAAAIIKKGLLKKEFKLEFQFGRFNDFVVSIKKLKPDNSIALAIGKDIVIYEDILTLKEKKYDLLGHSKTVLCLTQINDEKLASGSEDKTIKIWSLKTKQFLSTITGDFEVINCLLTLSNGHIAAGSHCSINVFNPDTKNQLYSFVAHEKSVASIIQINPRMIASSSYDYTIKLWDLNERNCEYTFFGHDQAVYCLLLLQDGKLASASGSWDKSIKIWSIRNKKCEFNLAGHQRDVKALIQLHNGYLVSGSTDKTVKIWNLHKKTCVQTLTMHSDVIFCFDIYSDRKFIVGSRDKSISIVKQIK